MQPTKATILFMENEASLFVRMLRWSEKHTKTDMVYLARGGFWLTLGTAFSMVSSLLFAWVCANFLAPEVYGTYKYVLSIVAIATLATLPGIDQALVQAVARGHEGTLRSTLRTKIRGGLVGAVGSLLVAGYYFSHGNIDLTIAFVIVAVFIPFMDSFTLYDDLLQGRRAFADSTKLYVTGQLLSVAMLIAVALFFPYLAVLVAAYIGGWTLIRGVLFSYALHTYKPNNIRDETASRYGAHLTVMKIAATVGGSLGGIIIFHILGGTGLAIYALAVAPVEQMRGWLSMSGTLLLPKFSKDSWEVISFGAFIRKTWPFFVAIALMAILYALLAPLLFSVLFPKYMASVGYSQALMFTLPLSIATLLFSIILRAKKQVRKLHIANIVSITTNIAFSVPLTYFLGIGGLVIAIFVNKIIDVVVQSYLIFWTKALSENNPASNFEEKGISVNM